MSRKKRYIEQLTTQEIKDLENGFKSGKSHTYRSRCKSILLSHQGWQCSSIAEFFGVALITVYKWLDRWEAGGIENLSDKAGRGRKPILDLSKSFHVELVNKAIEESPSNIRKAMFQIEGSLDVTMSRKTLQRFLKRLSGDGKGSGNPL